MRIHVYIIFLGGALCFARSLDDFDKMVKKNIRGTVPLIYVSELNAQMKKKNIYLMDVRTQKEFNVSHIKGAWHLTKKNWNDSLIKVLSGFDGVVCYCSVGARSEKKAEWLVRKKVKNVKNLFGGIFAWSRDKFPLVNQSGKPTTKVHPYKTHWAKWIKPSDVAYE